VVTLRHSRNPLIWTAHYTNFSRPGIATLGL
jgi:hypothetical protein